MVRYFLFMILLLPGFSAAATYNLADLTVLHSEGSAREFLDHALDIRPSERAQVWKTMVGEMAQKYARTLTTSSEIPRGDFVKMEEIYRWPVLRQDDVFRVRRNEVGTKYLKNCLRAENPCWNDLVSFWKEDSSDPDMAVGLAELVKDRSDAPYSLWTLLERPLKTPFSEFYCKKTFVREALWKKLEGDYLKIAREESFLGKIEETIHADCLPSLIEEARARIYRPVKDGDRELAYEILSSTRKADQKLKDFFFTLYLLEHPSQGELMNLSWNNLTELGKSATRRETVLEEMKNLDPLPDDIMGSMDLTKKRAILRHVKANFPEYFDFYSEQCVAYYGGKKKFSKGNPTMKCQDLMNSDLASEILPETKIQQFHSVKQI